MNLIQLAQFCRSKKEFTFWELENAGIGSADQVKLMLDELVRLGKVITATENNKCCSNGKGCGSCTVERFQVYQWKG